MNFAKYLTAFSMFSVVAGVTLPASAVTLSTDDGSGSLDEGAVEVGVDPYGSFGSSVGGSGTSNAFFNPIGSQDRAGTAYESGVAFRLGNSGNRSFATTGNIGSSGGLSDPGFTSTTDTSATSNFNLSAGSIELTQELEKSFDTSGNRTGSLLTQTAEITNTSSQTQNFELVRYLDGDLLFNGTLTDGGGKLGSTLFETDSATGAADEATFVGITGEGGNTLTTNRFEIDSFSGLRDRIINGDPLDDTVTGDGSDADNFIDSGNGFDVTLALRNEFSNVQPGETVTYTTTTNFGRGQPQQQPDPSQPVPFEAEGTAGLVALGGFFGYRYLKNRKKRNQALSPESN